MTGNCSAIWTWKASVMGAFFYAQNRPIEQVYFAIIYSVTPILPRIPAIPTLHSLTNFSTCQSQKSG